ncbi:flagellar basal body rod protein [Anaerobacillus alkalidiazotrophicus]|uniref:Flagellar basal body rod protein n=1 Tax=Anaerobacillus alkalidiazotrophicus TaxID=472963 RepID=A0A1S2M9H5_9BACI|nr:flagellar basal body rod protein [Anaerobacillus alkalidiazotrophicus]OIJ21264.1 flagellar basal body rod protein [Anaerobacillus alkalidiazotrophicus]
MKKLGLIILGGIAAIILIANLGPIVLFGLSLIILYYAFKGFFKAETSVSKVTWAILGLILFTITASNVPALVGLVAAIILYFVYKKWNEDDEVVILNENNENNEKDPFINFEKEWAELKRNF